MDQGQLWSLLKRARAYVGAPGYGHRSPQPALSRDLDAAIIELERGPLLPAPVHYPKDATHDH